MGMWQNLVVGYDQNREALEVQGFYLASVSCSVRKYSKGRPKVEAVVFVLNDNSTLKEIRLYEYEDDEVHLLISEKSDMRTNAAAPHCLFDQVKYLIENGKNDESHREEDQNIKVHTKTARANKAKNETPFEQWKKLLFEFTDYAGTIDELKVVRCFVETEGAEGIKKALNQSGIKYGDKWLVLFEVVSDAAKDMRLWENIDLYKKWYEFCLLKKQNEDRHIDFISGVTEFSTSSFGKRIYNNCGNAKLISSNDTTNFTFRGMLLDPFQVAYIGYESSQKAHQFLRYLISSRGICCESQVIVSWSIGGVKDDAFLPPPVSEDEFKLEDDVADSALGLPVETGINYADALRRALNGGRYSKLLASHPYTAVLALDAPSDGRLSITFYRELDSKDYLEKIQQWHEVSAWPLHYWKKIQGDDLKIKCEKVCYVGAPSVDAVVEAAYGRQKSLNDDGYKKIKMDSREVIIRCIFDGQPIPEQYLRLVQNRLSRPHSISKSNGKFDADGFNRTLDVFCSILKQNKYYKQKEVIGMALEKDRRDRSYLYGRLLAAADNLEEYALGKGGRERTETAALRYMQLFAQRPFTTWETIHRTLAPYLPKVRGCIADQEIGEIHKLFSGGDFVDDTALDGYYLLGYYHERAYIKERVCGLCKTKDGTLTETENNEQE